MPKLAFNFYKSLFIKRKPSIILPQIKILIQEICFKFVSHSLNSALSQTKWLVKQRYHFLLKVNKHIFLNTSRSFSMLGQEQCFPIRPTLKDQ